MNLHRKVGEDGSHQVWWHFIHNTRHLTAITAVVAFPHRHREVHSYRGKGYARIATVVSTTELAVAEYGMSGLESSFCLHCNTHLSNSFLSLNIILN